MKIAISTENGYVAAHFGRCAKYTIVDIEDNRISHKEEIDNPGHQPGFLPQFLSERGVDLIISGGMGPRAQGLFAQKSIKTIIGVQGPVDEIIEKYIQGQLESGEDLCDHGHGHHMNNGQHECSEQHPLPLKKSERVCITSLGDTLDSEVDPKFGRAQYFLFITPSSDQAEALANPYKDLSHGAGIKAAQFVASKNPSVVITGDFGPNADRVLKESGIRTITGVRGNVKEVLRDFWNEKNNAK
jgi:predicted Fe-Mo cluster-binding NifX family protein